MTKVDVFLSAGHGGTDPGAVAYGLKEKDINLNIMKTCASELRRHGLSVACSRTKDENDPVSDEVREANASGAKVAVSFHTNAGGGDGSESLHHSSNKDAKKLATLCEKYVKALGQNSRGVKVRDDLWFLRGTKMTAVLCECAFIDNNKDNNIIDTVKEQQKFGVAYAMAILEYLKITYKEPVTKKEKIEKGFVVRVDITDLNIRKGPGTDYDKTGKVTGKGKFTIVNVKEGKGSKTGWGKLKSGAGWISMDYAKRV